MDCRAATIGNLGKKTKGKDMLKSGLTDKKPWQKPELIVLVRSQPEEAVLIGCKLALMGGAGSMNSQCQQKKPCATCRKYTLS